VVKVLLSVGKSVGREEVIVEQVVLEVVVMEVLGVERVGVEAVVGDKVVVQQECIDGGILFESWGRMCVGQYR
jgi:hypothetical protein